MLVTWKSRSSARFATNVVPWHIALLMIYAVLTYSNALQLLNLTPGRKRNSVCTCLSACCSDLQLYACVHSAGRGRASWASLPFLGTSADKAAAESHNSPPSVACATSERL